PGKRPRTLAMKLSKDDLAPASVVIAALEDAPASEPGGRPREDRGPARGTVRVVGYAALGLGAAGVAAGSILGALPVVQGSDPGGRANGVCSAAGASVRQSALGLAEGSSIALPIGGAALVAGVVLVVLTREPAKHALTFAPLVGAGAGGVVMEGRF